MYIIRFDTLHRKSHRHVNIVNRHVDIANRCVDVIAWQSPHDATNMATVSNSAHFVDDQNLPPPLKIDRVSRVTLHPTRLLGQQHKIFSHLLDTSPVGFNAPAFFYL